ncbi:MAG: DUF2029 domain-containing protein [Lachnospiraceae bacterium]|nr:DUF2029 domain-containing protein [Lachnospiraceae bacterium]
MQLLRKWKDNKALRAAVLVMLAALALVSVIKGLQNAAEFSQDFQWDAAKALTMRLDPYELSLEPSRTAGIEPLDRFYRMFTDRGLKQKMEANQFPSLLMLLAPMTVFSPQAAKIVWAVLNIGFTAGIVWLLGKTFFEHSDRTDFAAVMLLMIAGTPYRNQLGVGQHTLFAFFFFMLAVFIDRHSGDRAGLMRSAGITLCLAVSYFKYTLTAPLALYFLFRKRYREFAASVMIHVILTAFAALWLGKSFIYLITAPLKVASVLASEGGIDLGVFLPQGLYAAAAVIIAALLLYLALKMPEDAANLLFSILILWSLVITYHRTYDFFVFSAAAAMFVRQCPGDIQDDKSGRRDCIMFIWYALLMFMLCFLLRIFDENAASKLIVGITYYLFTIAATIKGVRSIRKSGSIRG